MKHCKPHNNACFFILQLCTHFLVKGFLLSKIVWNEAIFVLTFQLITFAEMWSFDPSRQTSTSFVSFLQQFQSEHCEGGQFLTYRRRCTSHVCRMQQLHYKTVLFSFSLRLILSEHLLDYWLYGRQRLHAWLLWLPVCFQVRWRH